MPTGAGRLEADRKLEKIIYANDEITTELMVTLMMK
jgi:hypothetical protein